MDSITLGQLKAAAVTVKPKVSSSPPRERSQARAHTTRPLPCDHAPQPTQYDFRYEDSDTLMSELQEFFSYEDVNHLDRGLDAFRSSAADDTGQSTSGWSDLSGRPADLTVYLSVLGGSDWSKRTPQQKETFVQAELAKLTADSPDLDAARSLFYTLQGQYEILRMTCPSADASESVLPRRYLRGRDLAGASASPHHREREDRAQGRRTRHPRRRTQGRLKTTRRDSVSTCVDVRCRTRKV